MDWDNTYRMALAEELGADLVLGKDHDVVASILQATDGSGVDNSCEFSGFASALSNAIHSTFEWEAMSTSCPCTVAVPQRCP